MDDYMMRSHREWILKCLSDMLDDEIFIYSMKHHMAGPARCMDLLLEFKREFKASGELCDLTYRVRHKF